MRELLASAALHSLFSSPHLRSRPLLSSAVSCSNSHSLCAAVAHLCQLHARRVAAFHALLLSLQLCVCAVLALDVRLKLLCTWRSIDSRIEVYSRAASLQSLLIAEAISRALSARGVPAPVLVDVLPPARCMCVGCVDVVRCLADVLLFDVCSSGARRASDPGARGGGALLSVPVSSFLVSHRRLRHSQHTRGLPHCCSLDCCSWCDWSASTAIARQRLARRVNHNRCLLRRLTAEV